MKEETKDIVYKVCCDVFEHLAFMFGEVLDEDDITSVADTFIKASMSFKGEQQSGIVAIVVPEELSVNLAYEILGLEKSEQIDPDGPEDAVKEVLNTICGRLLPAIFGDSPIFDLTPPETTVISYQEWEELVQGHAYISLEIENNPVLITTSL